MKKVLVILLFLMLTVSLMACGGGGDPAPSDSGDPGSSQEEQSGTDGSQTLDDGDGAVLPGTKTLAYFQKYVDEGAYTMEMKTEFDGMTSVSLSACDGENIYTESEIDGMKSIVILKDGAQYILDPSAKTCIRMSAQTADSQEMFAEEAENYETAVNTGETEVDGKRYFYEEFTVEGASMKYCFDGDALKYMVMEMEGSEGIIEILRMEKGADKSLFEIPDDYTIMEY